MKRIFNIRLNLDQMADGLDRCMSDADFAAWVRGFRLGCRGVGVIPVGWPEPAINGHALGLAGYSEALAYQHDGARGGRASAEARKSSQGTARPTKPNINPPSNPPSNPGPNQSTIDNRQSIKDQSTIQQSQNTSSDLAPSDESAGRQCGEEVRPSDGKPPFVGPLIRCKGGTWQCPRALAIKIANANGITDRETFLATMDKIAAWCEAAPPAKLKTKTGMGRFVNSWFGRQDQFQAQRPRDRDEPGIEDAPRLSAKQSIILDMTLHPGKYPLDHPLAVLHGVTAEDLANA